jgi:diguanylate cyclase (GGDEF)-like protein
MSFRGRLRLFFTILVIIPMLAVALVLLRLTGESEKGKADAALATGLRVAFANHADASHDAQDDLRRVARDPGLTAAVGQADDAEITQALNRVVARYPGIVSVGFQRRGGPVLQGGAPDGVAAAKAPLASPGGKELGALAVSVTSARQYVTNVSQLTGLDAGVIRQGRILAATAPGAAKVPTGKSSDFTIAGDDYRGRADRVDELIGPPVNVAVFDTEKALTGSLTRSRLLIGGILLAFLMLALASSIFVVRALQGQIGQFLDAAQRLAQGDFKHPVPIYGHDEFALLGREFNNMSSQLEAKIQEVEHQRGELEETIRRVGEAFASGLDPQGVVELTVDTALDACDAEAGRVLPLVDGRIAGTHRGSEEATLLAALSGAERQALQADEFDGGRERRAVEAEAAGSYALAMPVRARHGSRPMLMQVGLVSIARRGRSFTRQERELLEYLASQAGVSIENADLHETVQRQAVTDELTGLSNVRELHSTLDREIERARRFSSPLGLVMLDLDDFKRVNDQHGHQQGDEVLVEVARVLRDLSRDIDEPARYGGEELAVVTPQTDAAGAAQLAERMREAIEVLRIPRLDGKGEITTTASFGVASLPDTASDKGSLIAAADAALYRAKRAGKNRVERASSVAAPR